MSISLSISAFVHRGSNLLKKKKGFCIDTTSPLRTIAANKVEVFRERIKSTTLKQRLFETLAWGHKTFFMLN